MAKIKGKKRGKVKNRKAKVKDNSKTLIISLGGSLIVPIDVDIAFLKAFKAEILDYVSRGNKVVIVCGGGGTNRLYNQAAKALTYPQLEDLDWIGIAATKLNAELVRVMFGELAYEKVIFNPTEKIKAEKNIIVASGWKPGCSSDNDAVLLASNFGAKSVVNLTNIDYIYDKDPKRFEDAKKFEHISWKEYLSLVGKEWKPRMSVPFDPVASKLAMQKGITVRIISGKKIDNIRNLLEGREVEGTIIS